MIDWEAVRAEVTGYLQALIRIDTTNPPGNESKAAHYLEGILRQEGFDPSSSSPHPSEATSSRGCPAATNRRSCSWDIPTWWPPSRSTGPTRPSRVPLADGCVWGRGALDMKNMVATNLMVLLLLQREGVQLNRDIVFAATADEEAGKGNHGPGWIIDHRPELWDAPLIITEGGGSDFAVGGQRFYTCQTGQKGLCRLHLIARGTPGHGSMPHGDSAIVKLSKALAGLEGAVFPAHISASVRHFVEGIASRRPAPEAALWQQVLDPTTSDAALRDLPIGNTLRRELGAVLHNTASATMVQAGSKINVIPGEATAWIDGRLVPGQTAESFAAELRAFVGEEVAIEIDQYTPPLEASSDTPLFQTIVEVMQEHEPNAPVLPYLMPAGTDAKHIVPRRPETQIYGFMPYRQQPGEEEMALIHGHDERISVEELLFATQVLYEIVCRFGGDREPLARIDDSDAIVDFEDQNLIAGVERYLEHRPGAPTVRWCGLGR